jgi:hypothetical protein
MLGDGKKVVCIELSLSGTAMTVRRDLARLAASSLAFFLIPPL